MYDTHLRVGYSHHHHHISHPPVGDEHFTSVEDPIVAIFLGVCSDSLQITDKDSIEDK